MDTITAAIEYRSRGYYAIPIPPGTKGPVTNGWNRLRIEAESVPEHFCDDDNIGVLLGEPSGGLIDVDLDCPEAIELAEKYLPATGAITGRDGSPRSHWWYVCPGCSTMRLSDRLMTGTAATTVELRSTGLQTLVGPSIHPSGAKYDLLCGDPATVEPEAIRAAVQALHEAVLAERGHTEQPTEQPRKSTVRASDDTSPGSDYSARGDVLDLLNRHGWKVAQRQESGDIRLTRPGKVAGISATLFADRTFFCFSSSVPNIEPDKSYTPFGLLAALEHNGDHAAAASALAAAGYGRPAEFAGVDISGIVNGLGKDRGTGTAGSAVDILPDPADTEPAEEQITDPGEFPQHLLNVPGFISEVAAYTESIAFRSQPVLSLWGAICLQSVLCGRKICDSRNSRTNLYVIAMAPSGRGKNAARVTNREILVQAGLSNLEGAEDIASDAGLLQTVRTNPACLMQLDEVGRLLKAIGGAGEKSPHLYNISTLLLRLFSSSETVYRGKTYADGRPTEIDQPCLTVYGTTVEESFWGSLTSESIGDGFLARMIPVIGDPKPKRRLKDKQPIPESVIDHAIAWGAVTTGGNLSGQHPRPIIVPYTPEADSLFWDWCEQWEDIGNASTDWQPIWVRTAEKAAKLALIYAASRSVTDLQVDEPAIRWACEIAEYTTRLFQRHGNDHITDSDFEDQCQKTLRAITAQKKFGYSWRQICQHRCWRGLQRRQKDEIIAALTDRGEIVFYSSESAFQDSKFYATRYAPDAASGG